MPLTPVGLSRLRPARMFLLSRSAVFVLLALATLWAPCAASAKVKVEEARLALEKARAASDIRKEGGAAFHLRAEVRMKAESGEMEEGVYEEYWVNPTQWRREMRFPSFREVEILKDGQMSRQRSALFQPKTVSSLCTVLRYLEKVSPEETRTDRAFDCGRPGDGTRCFKLEWDKQAATIYRFDAASGVLLERDWGKGRAQYGEYGPFCEALVPGVIRLFKDGALVAEVQFKERTVLPLVADSLLEAPKDAQTWPWCEEPTRPKVKTQVKPNYPPEESAGGVQGRVILQLLLDAEGKVKAAEVLESAGKHFDAAALTAVRQWTFEPPRCRGIAVPAEHILSINFTMK